MVRRSPQAQARFERSSAEREAAVDLTQSEYQSLRMIAQGRIGKLRMRKLLASKGLITSTVSSRMAVTEKDHRSLEAYKPKGSPAAGSAKPSGSSVEEDQRERWLRQNAPPFRRAAP